MSDIWLIGSGYMALEYAAVLDGLQRDFLCIGRSSSGVEDFRNKTGKTAIDGGLLHYLEQKPNKCQFAIVAASVEELYLSTLSLVKYGVPYILLEKPGAMHYNEFISLQEEANRCGSKIYIAYNRRFYASVCKAKEIIQEDGGVQSFAFEFTEWSHIIENLNKTELAKSKWFLGNSTHVVDLAFYLGGKPEQIFSLTKSNLKWHPASSIFVGCGSSKNGALFSYMANWESAGRWCVEILTKKHRLILKPLEKLFIQKKGSIDVQESDEINYFLDEKYKPGLYLQVKSFLEEKTDNLCSLKEQIEILGIYYKMANYIKD